MPSQALEGLGDSQAVRSQEITSSRADLENDADLIDMESKVPPETYVASNLELPGVDRFSLEDEGRISPPDSVYDSSSGSGGSSEETSWPDGVLVDVGVTAQLPPGFSGRLDGELSNIQEALLNVNSEYEQSEFMNHDTVTSPFAPSGRLETLAYDAKATNTVIDPLHSSDQEKSGKVDFEATDETEILDHVKGQNWNHEHTSTRVKRGKNKSYSAMLWMRMTSRPR